MDNTQNVERIARMMEKAQKGMNWTMPVVLLAVGMPFVIAALYMAGEELKFRNSAVLVQGLVIEQTGDVPALIVEYQAPDGSKQRLETFGSDLYADVPAGEKLGVFVKRDDPAQGRLDHFVAAWMLPLILGAFGAFWTIPGLLSLRGALRGPLQKRRLQRVGQPVQGTVKEIQPEISLAAMIRRTRAQGNMQCSIWKEDDRWHLTVNEVDQDPFALNANRDWGVQYKVIAEWRDPATGKTYECESDTVDADPTLSLSPGRVTVIRDPDNPKNCRVDLGLLSNSGLAPGEQA